MPEVFDMVTVRGRKARVVALFGKPATEALVDVFPGAFPGYEYVTMWDEVAKKPVLRALNLISIKEITGEGDTERE